MSKTESEPPETETRTAREKVIATLENADEPLSLKQINERRSDMDYKAVSATLSDLTAEDTVSREGEGGSGDPFQYSLQTHPNDAIETLFDGDDPEEDGPGLTGIFDEDPDSDSEEDEEDPEEPADADDASEDEDADDDSEEAEETDRTSTRREGTKRSHVLDVLEQSEDPRSVTEIANAIPDMSKRSVSTTTSDLYLNTSTPVSRVGGGVRGDPYRYYIPEDSEEDVDLGNVAAVEESRRSRQIALDYVQTADGEELTELWEAAGVIPSPDAASSGENEAEEQEPEPTLPFGKSEWIDILRAVSGGDIDEGQSRYLVSQIGRFVWGDEEN